MNQAEIVARMKEVAPPGPEPTTAQYDQLRELTTVLTSNAGKDYGGEHAVFSSIALRDLPDGPPGEWVKDKHILVTGGTGCVGSLLIQTLLKFAPGSVSSVSRGYTQCPSQRHFPAVKYFHADVRDPQKLEEVFRQVRPEVVFHVAGQRDPGLAEREARLTATVNVVGTYNVLQACHEYQAQRFIFAGTGKAVRPYSQEVYTSSKRVAEWLVADAARHGLACGGTRFTHVVDNSIVCQRLRTYSQINIHDPEIMFYVQSAKECASLLLLAGEQAVPGEFRIHAITDLGMPVSLLDLAISVVAGRKDNPAIWFSGYDSGYEATPYRGLYDPANAGDVSPLINALEAHDAKNYHGADYFTARYSPRPAEAIAMLTSQLRRTTTDSEARKLLDLMALESLHLHLGAAPRCVLKRMRDLAKPHPVAEGQKTLATAVNGYAG